MMSVGLSWASALAGGYGVMWRFRDWSGCGEERCEERFEIYAEQVRPKEPVV